MSSSSPFPPGTKPIGPRDERILRHVRAMAECEGDAVRFAVALQAFRDDGQLNSAQRDAIFKTLAQDAMHAFCAIATGIPLDLRTLFGLTPEMMGLSESEGEVQAPGSSGEVGSLNPIFIIGPAPPRRPASATQEATGRASSTKSAMPDPEETARSAPTRTPSTKHPPGRPPSNKPK